MKRPKVPYPWVKVKWSDITGMATWGSPSEIRPSVVYQEGFLIWEDDKFIVVSNAICGQDFSNRDAIPKATIIELDYGRARKAAPAPVPPKEEGKP